MDAELDALVSAFKAKGIARVNYKRAMSCVSLICNVEKTSQILERVRPAYHVTCYVIHSQQQHQALHQA